VTEKVTVVGHSMGGIVASQIAATYPDLVRGVVLLGPVNPVPALAEVFGKRIEVVKKGQSFSAPQRVSCFEALDRHSF